MLTANLLPVAALDSRIPPRIVDIDIMTWQARRRHAYSNIAKGSPWVVLRGPSLELYPVHRHGKLAD